MDVAGVPPGKCHTRDVTVGVVISWKVTVCPGQMVESAALNAVFEYE